MQWHRTASGDSGQAPQTIQATAIPAVLCGTCQAPANPSARISLPYTCWNCREDARIAAISDMTNVFFPEWQKAIKRPVPVFAMRVEGPFRVTTREGHVLMANGGWLLEDPTDGRRWPVDDAYFERHYYVDTE